MPGEDRPEDSSVHPLIEENISVNELLQAQAERERSSLHRPLERFGMLVGSPRFVLTAFGLFLLWIGGNLGVKWRGDAPWDEPPFFWLQGVIGLLALLVTTSVLVAQSRQGQIAEQRAQLALQIALLTEQRSAKIIALIEELRLDLPNVQNRRDTEAAQMAEASDPEAIVEALITFQEGEPPHNHK